jgi:CBS domain-containing protein
MKVKDVMHKGVDWVSPETPVSELAKLMCEHDTAPFRLARTIV